METLRAALGAPTRTGPHQAWRRPGRWRVESAATAAIFSGLLLAGGSVATAATSTTTAPPAPNRVTFGVEPASATGADGRPYFSIDATPGAVVFDHVAAVNYSTTPVTLQLYATDAVETVGGGFGLLPASTKPTSVGAWITIPPRFATVVVPPRTAHGPGQVVAPVTVRVPLKEAPGDHAGGIVVSLQTVGTNRSGQSVILDQRVGTRVYVDVTGVLTPKLTLADLHATYDGTANPVGKGHVAVSYRVVNTGNADLSLTQSVNVSALVADSKTVAIPKIPILLPGASVAESVVVPGVWPQFRLSATVTAQPKVISTVTSAPAMAAVTAGTSVWGVPWTLLLIIVVLVVALVLWRRLRARRDRPGAPPEAVKREAVKV